MSPTLSLLAALSTASAAAPVTFTLDVQQDAFLKGRSVTISILDSEQIRRAKENEDCVTSWDGHGNVSHICLDGRKPLDITPETFTVTWEQLAAPLVITSKTVSPGEAYRLSISGEASDNCNSAGGNHEGVASAAVKAKPMIWTTEMGCIGME